MKVLFICSGNRGISPQIQDQAVSLNNKGIELKIFPIIGKGVWGYLKNIPQLRKQIVAFNPDIIHSHYSFCGIIAALSSKLPIVTTLMGSDVYKSQLYALIDKFFAYYIWNKTIVQSNNMKDKIGKNVYIIPNGINLDIFKPLDRYECIKQLGLDVNVKHILFVSSSNPQRTEKNLPLALEAINTCSRSDIKLQILSNIQHNEMPLHLNAASLLLLTSKWEGSPVVVKEAMACNIPVVATKVGDIEYLFENTEGCYYTDPASDKLAEKINYILNNQIEPNGRHRIIDLKLDSESIADKLIQLYQEVLSK